MTYDEAISFWFGRINYEVRSATPFDLKLERMRALLRRLGDPHELVRTIHITGTKGKGSTAAMTAAILRAAGYRVGLFTSPHLCRVEERTQVNGEPISPGEVRAAVARIADVLPELERGPWPQPTFFELSTAIGFLHFWHRRVDFAVVEVGLGGRFDSTNVCRPIATVITSIGLDHTAQLGNTLEEIADQKAGIIKPGVPVVSGVTQPGPRGVIEQQALAAGSRLVQYGRDFGYAYRFDRPTGRGLVDISTPNAARSHMPLGLLGEHQAANAAIAVTVIDELRRGGIPVAEAAIRSGLSEVDWPARIQVVGRHPTVILDTAHNVPSVEALVTTLRQACVVEGERAVVFAVSGDKDYPAMMRILSEYFDVFHLTRYSNNARGVPPEQLREVLFRVAPSRRSTVHSTAIEAWVCARSRARPEDLLCVTGSVFLAGELRDQLSTL